MLNDCKPWELFYFFMLCLESIQTPEDTQRFRNCKSAILNKHNFLFEFPFFFFFNEMFFKLGDELNHLLLGHLWHFSLPQIALHCQLQKWKELKQQKQQHTFWIQTLLRKLSHKACFFDRRDANTRKEFLFPSLFSNY